MPPEVSLALAEEAVRPGEVHRLAVPLARKLNLTRLHHIDDHTDARIDQQMGVIQQYWQDPAVLAEIEQYPAMRKESAALARANAAHEYWDYLLYSNSAEWVEDSHDLEVGSYLRSPLPEDAHRARVAQWDARNLFMAARLRVVTAPHAGQRVLVIVGAAHKGPLERVLRSVAPDLRLVALSELAGSSQD